MKVKFAVEKSMYSNLLMELMSGKEDVNTAVILIKMKTIEEIIQAYDDEIITVVSTQKTYDGPAATSPMETRNEEKPETYGEEFAKQAKEPDVETSDISTKDYVESEIDTSKPLPSPKCTKCAHRMISHNRKGCRFCDCEEKRKRK